MQACISKGESCMEYEKVLEKELREEFQNPPVQFRGTPFWAWNCHMTEEKADHILTDLKEMGMGGAYFHCRTGMNMPYLGERFMEMMHYAHDKACQLGMVTCLYDEDRWPSGAAGGLVTKDEQYRSRFLAFSPVPLPLNEKVEEGKMDSSAKAVSSGKRKFLAAYQIRLKKGYLEEYRFLDQMPDQEAVKEEERQGWDTWYAYLEIAGNNPWFNNQAYLNTLDPKAVAKFLEVTYDAYYKEFAKDFGKTIPTIFTDEPQFTFKTKLGYAEEKTQQVIPYTDDFEETYKKAYGERFLPGLPEIFWELPEGQLSVKRYRYHDHVCQRFTESFADQVGGWCRNHHIKLTGHMMREPFLEGQTMALGEAMRAYRGFDIPGIDMLCDDRELTTAKQAQSAVHQYGYSGMTSEIYGVTNWDFDFRGHKLAGDWQAALGVTKRVHHLTWTTMEGEAKRDYPASIGYQSPWYRKYSYIENYFSRLNTVLSRGKALVKVGVIHPIESYWLYWGTREHTDEICRQMEDNFANLVKWLLYGLIDFDFISESLLADFNQKSESGFDAGEMNYDAVLVPSCVTLRQSTLKRLEDFAERGGKVIFAGNIPSHVDGVLDNRCRLLADRCVAVGFSRLEILESLESERILEIRTETGSRAENLLYQMREEGRRRWLFIAHCEKSPNPDLVQKERLRISVKGVWEVIHLHPETGSWTEQTTWTENGSTYWETDSYDQDSFLYCLIPSKERCECKGKDTKTKEEKLVSALSVAQVTLEEPNVLLLDLASYAFDDGDWQPEEEILRIDNLFRKELGLRLRTEAFPQPWVNPPKEEPAHRLKLRFFIESQWETDKVWLALEQAEKTNIIWNGIPCSKKPEGWYADRDIRKVELGALKKGENILEIHIPFTSSFQVEAMYLLGDFHVQVRGRKTKLQRPETEFGFGDICVQGLPFYGGNLSYHVNLEIPEEGDYSIQISKFRCPVIQVKADGRDCGLIACAPYQVSLGHLEAGIHKLEILAYGNRINTFGTVHDCNEKERWIGPDAWRTTGTSWSYEYCLKPSGILKAPVIKKAE